MIRAAMTSAASRRSTATPPEPDPLFSQVKLLVHADTNFADSSSMARAVTNVGGVGISGTSRFGAGAASFTTAGQRLDYAATDAAMNLPAGDFTIEAWVRFATKNNNSPTLVERFRAAGGGWRLQASTFSISFATTTSGGTNDRVSSKASRNLNQWYHIAVTRQGSTFRLFVDGALVSTGTDPNAIASSASTPISVGGSSAYGSAATLSGLIDDLRITVGTARYTAAFTPPTAAFPDS